MQLDLEVGILKITGNNRKYAMSSFVTPETIRFKPLLNAPLKTHPQFKRFTIDEFSYPVLKRNYKHRVVSFKAESIGNHLNSGWIIRGDLKEEHLQLADDFSAWHDKHGEVFGNFNETVYAENKNSILQLLKDHPFYVWDKSQ